MLSVAPDQTQRSKLCCARAGPVLSPNIKGVLWCGRHCPLTLPCHQPPSSTPPRPELEAGVQPQCGANRNFAWKKCL